MRGAFALIVLIFSFAVLPARADDDLINPDRPGIADGSQTVGRGTFQIETGIDREQGDNAFPTLLRYGISKNFEARVESDSALTHPLLGFKFHFADTPSLGVIVRAGEHHEGDVRLAADINLGEKWSLNPNVGINRDRGALAALTIQYNITQKANVFVDGGYDTTQLQLDAGAAWIIGRNTQLDASITWGAHGAGVPNVVYSAGISRRF
ncbi:MAG TPA: transporter [Thermoanaerobaculia bacterium]|nr:transporter [Thermoanaerobaculia bacterium]